MKKNIAIFSLACLFLLESLHGAANEPLNINKYNPREHLAFLNVSHNGKVLDIGCNLSLHIAKELVPQGQVVGIDHRQEVVDWARKNKISDNLSFVCADIVDYADSEEYDAIVSMWTLPRVSNYTQALNNVATSLKKGGRALLIHTIGSNPFLSIGLKLLKTEKWQDYQDNITIPEFLPEETVKSTIEKAGLKIKKFQIQRFFDSTLPVTLIQRDGSSLLHFLPEDLREEFCNEVINEFIKEHPLNEKNELTFEMDVVTMVLTKESIT